MTPRQRELDKQVAEWGIVATYAVCPGAPRVDATHVRVSDVQGRFLAGESVVELSAHFDLPVLQIENVLRFAMLSEHVKKTWLDRQLRQAARLGT